MVILLEYFNIDDKKLLKQARFSQFRHFKTQNFLPVGPNHGGASLDTEFQPLPPPWSSS